MKMIIIIWYVNSRTIILGNRCKTNKLIFLVCQTGLKSQDLQQTMHPMAKTGFQRKIIENISAWKKICHEQ